MIFLWFSIFCSTAIYLIFKIRKNLKANLSGIIIVNYLFAFILGLATSNISNTIETIINARWLPIALLIGFLFVFMFFLIGLSTEKAGITVTSIATRMSMAVPIFFSMFLFDEAITFLKIVKIIITLVAVVLAIYHKPDKTLKLGYVLLPFILFIGSGSIDTLVKTAQHLYVPDNEIQYFSTLLFGTSFLTSFFLLLTRKTIDPLFSRNTLLLGMFLGMANFGSLFFFMKALNNSMLDSSIVFGINNLAIVCISLLIGYFLFKEKLSRVNWAGVSLSMFCIILLTRF